MGHCRADHRWEIMRRVALQVAAVTLLAALSAATWAADPAEKAPPPQTVTVVIDYGDGMQKHFTAIAWQADMTVEAAMVQAGDHPRGIKYEVRGKGPTALLTKIDDVENEGGGQRNWIYRINDQPGDRSFAIAKLQVGDTVLWSFETYR